MIDSGVHADHPYVGGVVGGIAIEEDGESHGDYVDRLGHGTAVTAAIKEKAPEADLYVIKVFGHSPSTSSGVLIRAIDEAVERGARIVNLSFGTDRHEHELMLWAAVNRGPGESRAGRVTEYSRGPSLATGKLGRGSGSGLRLGVP